MHDIPVSRTPLESRKGDIQVEIPCPGEDRKVDGKIDGFSRRKNFVLIPGSRPDRSSLLSVHPSGRSGENKRNRIHVPVERKAKKDVEPGGRLADRQYVSRKPGSLEMRDGRTGRIVLWKKRRWRDRKRNLIDAFLSGLQQSMVVGKCHVKENGVKNTPQKEENACPSQNPEDSPGPFSGNRMGNSEGVKS
jgi:hypothetical protein